MRKTKITATGKSRLLCEFGILSEGFYQGLSWAENAIAASSDDASPEESLVPYDRQDLIQYISEFQESNPNGWKLISVFIRGMRTFCRSKMRERGIDLSMETLTIAGCEEYEE